MFVFNSNLKYFVQVFILLKTLPIQIIILEYNTQEKLNGNTIAKTTQKVSSQLLVLNKMKN